MTIAKAQAFCKTGSAMSNLDPHQAAALIFPPYTLHEVVTRTLNSLNIVQTSSCLHILTQEMYVIQYGLHDMYNILHEASQIDVF